MPDDWHNPLNSIANAVMSTIGWAVMIACLVYLGLVLGCLPKHPNDCMTVAMGYLGILPFVWIFSPVFLAAYIVIPIAYWWPLHSESSGAFTTAGVITVLTWAIASALMPF